MTYGMVRCAACGSKNVMIDSEQSRFSEKKAVIGAAAIGIAGAAAGFIGDKKAVYKCKDCGMELSYCMDAQTALQIDIAVTTGITDENWTMLKKKYSNIENGAVEAAASARTQGISSSAKDAKQFLEEYIQEMRRRWTPEQVTHFVELYKKQAEEKEKHAQKVEEFDAQNGFVQAREKLNATVLEREQEAKAIAEKKTGIQKQVISKTEEKSKLGIFSGKRKKQLQEEVEALQNEIAPLTEAYNAAVQRTEQAKTEIQTFEAKRIDAFEKVGLSIVPPIPTLLTDPMEIGNIYSGMYYGGEFEKDAHTLPSKRALANDLISKLILFLAQFEMPVYEMYSVIKKTCADMGFEKLPDRESVVKQNQLVGCGVRFDSTDKKNVQLVKLLTRRYPTPQFPGHPKVAITAYASQQLRENPYQIQSVVLTEEGKSFLYSELMYTVLLTISGNYFCGFSTTAPASWIKTVAEKQKFEEMRVRLREMMEQRKQAENGVPAAEAEVPKADGQVELLEKIAALHKQGILTDEEFQKKKADILAKM